MTDYESLSDFEINKAVAEALGYETREPDFYLEAFKNKYPNRVWFSRPDQDHSERADYCNNPSDAWPIITENKINLSFFSDEGGYAERANYVAPPNCKDLNVLRAAMIVFLKMEADKNE